MQYILMEIHQACRHISKEIHSSKPEYWLTIDSFVRTGQCTSSELMIQLLSLTTANRWRPGRGRRRQKRIINSIKSNGRGIISRQSSKPRHITNPRKVPVKDLLSIPYVRSLTEKASCILHRHRISTAVYPPTTLRKMLVHSKDKRDPLTTRLCLRDTVR